MRVIFVVPYPIEGASSRLRVWQYLKHLERLGVRCCFRPFMSSAFYKIVYQPGHFWLKTYHFIISVFNRLLDLSRIKKYDLVFVQREAFPFGPPVFEWIVANILRKPLVYDFDDAIFLIQRSEVNRAISFLKNPGKVARIISLSQQVIVGNDYLKEYAKRFNKNVTIIPTPIDSEKYKPFISPKENRIVVGWIGSHSTAIYLLELKEVFQKLKKEDLDLVIRLIGAEKYKDQLPGTECRAWRLEDEIAELSSFDIGLMPMPDNPWTKGKCAFKLLLYMSMGIPAICSPVGMNREIIRDGENGFLTFSPEEWFEKIQILVKNSDLRKKMGLQGRKTVEKKYDLKLWTQVFIEALKKTVKR